MNPVLLRRIALAVALAGVLAAWLWHRTGPGSGRNRTAGPAEATVEAFLSLETAETEFVQRHWTSELDAEKAEDRMTSFWDELNQAGDPWRSFAELPVGKIHLPDQVVRSGGEAQISRERFSGPLALDWSQSDRNSWLEGWARAGWKLVHSHWRLPWHEPDKNGAGPQSRIEAVLLLERPNPPERLQASLQLRVRWTAGAAGELEPDEVWVETLDLARRSGTPPFETWLEEELEVPRHTEFADPFLAVDLDGDGASELLLVGAGRWWRLSRAGSGSGPKSGPFPGLPAERLFAVAAGDADRDGRPELWLGDSTGLRLGNVRADGRLSGAPQPLWKSPSQLKHPQTLALGDVDGDGDADVWLAQYKLPYQGGQFPTPWFDANDGFSSFLLLNQGDGRFVDATQGAGLAGKSRRRTYAASFIDLDGDGDLDLVNVSDFAGVDVFLNDGRGHFQDATDTVGISRHGFGMGHAFNDANGDGLPDLLLLGMDSPVAERLNAFRLDRELPGRGPAGLAVRAAMVHGNRVLLGGPGGLRGVNDAGAEALRRTGWTWGCAWADFNNDGQPDLAVANGHETLASTRDYERQFWLHDCFVAGSTNAPVSDLFFRNAAGRRRADQASYGGWQANRFLLSGLGSGPLDVAWLLGVAETADCRNLVADDFDGDGRLDFAITTFELFPVRRQRLIVYRNRLPTEGRHWIGVQLSPADLGARVQVSTDSRVHTRWLVAGDSFRSQNPARLHFGLGTEIPRRVEVIRPGGTRSILDRPKVDAWQSVR